MKKLTCFIIISALFLCLCGCLPKVKLGDPAEDPFVYVELGEKNGVTYAYKIIYDGDYTALTAEQQAELVETELIEVTPYKTSTIYKCKGLREYFFADEKGKTSNCIYFYTSTVKDEYSLYSYNIKTGFFQTLVEAPASQMVIPDAEYEHGWIAKDATLFAINLEEGDIDRESTYNLENSELLFYSEGQEFDRKLTRLYTGQSDTIVCMNVEYYKNDMPDIPYTSYTYHFEVKTRTFIGPLENMLTN